MFAIMSVLSRFGILEGPVLLDHVRPELGRSQFYERLGDCIRSGFVEDVTIPREGKHMVGYSLSRKGIESLSPFGLTTTQVTTYQKGNIMGITAAFDPNGGPATFYYKTKKPAKGKPNRYVMVAKKSVNWPGASEAYMSVELKPKCPKCGAPVEASTEETKAHFCLKCGLTGQPSWERQIPGKALIEFTP